MTPQKIAAIRALAEDERGEPNTRRIAQEKLAKLKIEQPEMFHLERLGEAVSETIKRWNNPPNPRTQPREDYSKWRFMDMGNWKEGKNGNYVITVTLDLGTTFKVTVFHRKSLGLWGWSRLRQGHWTPTYSRHSFHTIGEAQRDAWLNLKT